MQFNPVLVGRLEGRQSIFDFLAQRPVGLPKILSGDR